MYGVNYIYMHEKLNLVWYVTLSIFEVIGSPPNYNYETIKLKNFNT